MLMRPRLHPQCSAFGCFVTCYDNPTHMPAVGSGQPYALGETAKGGTHDRNTDPLRRPRVTPEVCCAVDDGRQFLRCGQRSVFSGPFQRPVPHVHCVLVALDRTRVLLAPFVALMPTFDGASAFFTRGC